MIDGVGPLLGGGAWPAGRAATASTPRRSPVGEFGWLLCDAMTSGGLLAAIPPGASMPGWEIGRLVDGEPGAISVL